MPRLLTTYPMSLSLGARWRIPTLTMRVLCALNVPAVLPESKSQWNTGLLRENSVSDWQNFLVKNRGR